MHDDAPLQFLLAQLGDGDAAAAEAVFRTYEPYLRKVVRRQLPGHLRARFDSIDVVQSVWADLLQGFREAGWRFSSVAHLRAFLVRATRNRFIDRVRQQQMSLERERVVAGVRRIDGPFAATSSPSEEAEAGELWERLLALCPPEHRELLLLKRQGFSSEAIATRTGLHEGSVRRLLRDLARQLAFQGVPDVDVAHGPQPPS
jgi:RNA polymerase sigma factor (sigma-70 family)